MGMGFPETYRVGWPDNLSSIVTIAIDETGHSTIAITGHRARLASLHDYTAPKAIRAELLSLVQKHRAKIVQLEGAS